MLLPVILLDKPPDSRMLGVRVLRKHARGRLALCSAFDVVGILSTGSNSAVAITQIE